jgi:hypothetical protein
LIYFPCFEQNRKSKLEDSMSAYLPLKQLLNASTIQFQPICTNIILYIYIYIHIYKHKIFVGMYVCMYLCSHRAWKGTPPIYHLLIKHCWWYQSWTTSMPHISVRWAIFRCWNLKVRLLAYKILNTSIMCTSITTSYKWNTLRIYMSHQNASMWCRKYKYLLHMLHV